MCIYRIEYYSSIKKNEILQFSTSMDLKGIMISKNVRQRKTDEKSKTRNYREQNLGCQRGEAYREN